MLDKNKLKTSFYEALEKLKNLNSEINQDSVISKKRKHNLQKVLVANRGEIAKRFFLALHEEGIPSVAVVTEVDRGQSWYEFADEVVFIGEDANYTNISIVIAAANLVKANAIYSGYGFLSENADFVESIQVCSEFIEDKIMFMGPNVETMRLMGDKVSSRELAEKHNVPLFESSDAFENPDMELLKKQVAKIGYPVIVKLSAGGGGKGMYPVFEESELETAVQSCCRIGKDLYNDSRFFIEQFIQKPVHIEVQVFNGRAVGIRKCAVQRRNQKIIEESGNAFLEDHMALSFLSAAERLAIVSGYGNCGAGTVEFLIDAVNGNFGFMEMNTRLQVEYGVTDQSLDIDLAKWQILYFDGREDEINGLDTIKFRVSERKHAMECRIYAEEPENDYRPSPGTIQEISLPSFNGVRCDFGFVEGDKILSMYDPMIGKLITYGADRGEALIRMERALQELYIKGIKTNVNQLLRIVRHQAFVDPDYTNSLIPENPELGFKEEHNIQENTKDHVVFGAFTEHIKYLIDEVKKFNLVAKLEGLLDTAVKTQLPYKYNVDYNGNDYQIEFLQIETDIFYSYVNGKYEGKITLNNFNDRADDFLISYLGKSIRVRVDRHIGFISLRMRDENNKIKYYRMNVQPEGLEDADTAGLVCSPFQGSFVSFSKELRVGDTVKAGEPLMILSAMKMETVIESPIDGKIAYVIENGDISKLQIAKTVDGRIIGKSMQEGELLVRVESEKDETEESSAKKKQVKLEIDENSHTLDLMLNENGEEYILKNLDKHFEKLLVLFHSMVKGFVQQSVVVDKLKFVLSNVDPEKWKSLVNENRSDKISSIILHYVYIKRLFSPIVTSEGFSFPEELNFFLNEWNNPEAELSQTFKELINDILKCYGLNKWSAGSEIQKLQIDQVFYFMRVSFDFAIKHWPQIGKQVHIVGSLNKNSDLTKFTLKNLYLHTQYQIDNSSLLFLKKVFSEYFQEEGIEIYSSDIDESSFDSLRDEIKNSNLKNEKDLIPSIKNKSLKLSIEEKINKIKSKGSINRISSNVDDLYLYEVEEKNKKTLVGFAVLDFSNKNNYNDNFLNAKEFVSKLTSSFGFYKEKINIESSRIEFFIEGAGISLNSFSKADETLGYDNLKEIFSVTLRNILEGEILYGIIHGNVSYSTSDDQAAKSIIFKTKNNELVFDLFYDDDFSNPYNNLTGESNTADQRMYENDKWPVEKWAEQILDPGSMEEVKIDFIDNNEDGKPVGSKIIIGKIDTRNVCFYMKDFRIIGGATGDREGLKYAAASYLAYLKGWPLYVWNDSAGANIKEGVVSLNRGGQGFMMNSLLAHDVSEEKFYNYVSSVTDLNVKKTFDDINKQFSLDPKNPKREGSSMVVAVGIGASAGLDVYGSSQATIQLILDSENSYRVLTGSNVIKSVLGEDISNYEIGGAGILGKWTGIVDLIAVDKLDLIKKVYEINGIFVNSRKVDTIKRIKTSSDNSCDKYDSLVFDESIIENNVDNGQFFPYKDDYYGSNALIGGFAKISGRKVLVMGPRTNYGLRSTASVIRSRELLKIAYKTKTPQILIYGKKWIHSGDYDFNMQSRIDFMNSLSQKVSERIHILTNLKGLKSIDITSTADVVIFIKNDKMSDSDLAFAEKSSTFIVDSFEEAFNLSSTVLSLLDESNFKVDTILPEGKVKVPVDKGEPYDMIESVIKPSFDKDSFIEFYESMNQPAGPNLITGLARLDGYTVGIIADQPQIKGGGADAQGTEKFRVFTNFLNRKNIPIVMLSNSSGFVPGTQQERFRIQAIGAESLDENILGEVPVVSVVLNQNFGGRQIQAFSKFLRPGIVYLALSNATMAVMGASAAFDLLGMKKYNKLVSEGKKDEAEKFRIEFVENFLEKAKAENDATVTGVLDWTIKNPLDLRENMIKALTESFDRCNSIFKAKWPGKKAVLDKHKDAVTV